ncbi:uncharacterized protein LOC129234112 [Uloborus diversus]|uniref:uncharacterized protein LOC129234112 n=1 Tax=Uloborus diversus TaxID=327109 RepID=UPI00240955D2|nr:uncharacterized protein LOC129234112 [Uloborus diversus]
MSRYFLLVKRSIDRLQDEEDWEPSQRFEPSTSSSPYAHIFSVLKKRKRNQESIDYEDEGYQQIEEKRKPSAEVGDRIVVAHTETKGSDARKDVEIVEVKKPNFDFDLSNELEERDAKLKPFSINLDQVKDTNSKYNHTRKININRKHFSPDLFKTIKRDPYMTTKEMIDICFSGWTAEN